MRRSLLVNFFTGQCGLKLDSMPGNTGCLSSSGLLLRKLQPLAAFEGWLIADDPPKGSTFNAAAHPRAVCGTEGR